MAQIGDAGRGVRLPNRSFGDRKAVQDTPGSTFSDSKAGNQAAIRA